MEKLEQLAALLGQFLVAHDVRIATAESCTGGWLAQAITSVPGSSAWFERGFVTYSNDAKQEMLGVDAGLIEQYGAVSWEVARAMAEGALVRSHADISVAVTGIAGPGGGSAEKPVGTVWFAVAKKTDLNMRENRTQKLGAHPPLHPSPSCHEVCHMFQGDRHSVRKQAVKVGLGLLGACTLFRARSLGSQ